MKKISAVAQKSHACVLYFGVQKLLQRREMQTVEMLLGARQELEFADERKAREVVRQIRKLRWLGMFKEARCLEAAISQIPRGESVLLLPASTD